MELALVKGSVFPHPFDMGLGLQRSSLERL